MGLDMYLYRARGLYEYNAEDMRVRGAVEKITGMKVRRLVEEVQYWRKANQVRDWFARNLRVFADNGTTDLSIEDLRRLRDDVDTVLASTTLKSGRVANGYSYSKEDGKIANWEDGEVLADETVARRVLPTSEGFFFGSSDYNQYYWSDLKQTAEALGRIIEEHERAHANGIAYSYSYEESY